MHVRTANPAALSGSTRRKTRLAKVAVTLSSALALVGAGGMAAGASSHPAKSAAPSYASVEKSLTTLETSQSASLTETGSSLFYPLFSEWAATKPLGLNITTASTSSGVGQSSAENGTVNVGTSDSYIPPGTNSINIPVVISSQAVFYNLPGIPKTTHLKLDATVLSGIYSGQITTWNASAIQKLNPKVKLPSTPIVTLHRSGTSGDTFIFTWYIAVQDASSFVGGTANVSTGTPFPNIAGAQAESGNQGMVNGCEAQVGCIAYIGVSYLREAATQLGYAELLNGYKGPGGPHYVLPNAGNISAEVDSYKHIPTNGTISLIDSANAINGYPIVNFEYAVVQQAAANPVAIKALLAWGMDPRHGAAESFLAPVHFLPLTPSAIEVALGQLNSIT